MPLSKAKLRTLISIKSGPYKRQLRKKIKKPYFGSTLIDTSQYDMKEYDVKDEKFPRTMVRSVFTSKNESNLNIWFTELWGSKRAQELLDIMFSISGLVLNRKFL